MTPLLKRDGLNKNISANYRSISNVNTISRIMERLTLARLRQHLVGPPSVNSAQFAYRRRHMTESALLQTTDFAHRTIDRGKATMLIALDISAAFDMVVHSTLQHRLSYSFGIDDVTLRWIKSNLSERSQFVRIGTASSKPTYVISEFLKDRSLDLSFSPFIKLPMHTELYSSNMLTTRNYTLLCPRCVISECYHTTSKLGHCSTPMVCRKRPRVKPRQIGSSSIFDVSACQPWMQLDLHLLCPAS